jgi:hypothetical protein
MVQNTFVANRPLSTLYSFDTLRALSMLNIWGRREEGRKKAWRLRWQVRRSKVDVAA